MALIHGGQLQQIAEQYKISTNDWLDLSTGIAPFSYPIPDIPLSAWQQLPQRNPELIAAAKQYYQCSQLVVTNGSQAIIKALPELYRQKNIHARNVYLPERGYKEHAHSWKTAGYRLHFYQASLPDITTLLPNSVLVAINPNNPTGQFFAPSIIKQYHEKLSQLNGLLVLDEAFMDVMSKEQSYSPNLDSDVVTDSNSGHVMVLRSFGKFFGLAGIRIGFLIADNTWCKSIASLLGPWQVNGPAQIIAERALADISWQIEQKSRLKTLRKAQEKMLNEVFSQALVLDIKGCDLFLTLRFHQVEHAKKIHHSLCQQGVYCRLADEKDTIRFGITVMGNFKRLESACRQAYTRIIAGMDAGT
tara:strand:+ start:11832 stop:12911 length:1080 start_codon:yes stop_codon:yes gene_type:complete